MRKFQTLPVHVVSKGQDDLQHPLEPLAPLHLLGALEHGLDLWLDLREPDVELLLVVQRPQPLLVVSYSAIVTGSVGIW